VVAHSRWQRDLRSRKAGDAMRKKGAAVLAVALMLGRSAVHAHGRRDSSRQQSGNGLILFLG
jgi:hypothetical protein